MAGWAGGVVRCFCPSPLWFPMEDLKFKNDPTLSSIQRMIWSAIRLIAMHMRIVAPIAGRDSEQRD